MARLLVRGVPVGGGPAGGRLDQLLDAVRFWAAEYLWLEYRKARWEAEDEALHEWTQEHPLPHSMRWAMRCGRERHCFGRAQQEGQRMASVVDKVFVLILRQDRETQGAMTQLWYRLLNERKIPMRRPTRYPADWPSKVEIPEEQLVGVGR